MPIVNYVREHTRFIEYASDERLTGSERLLWYALMHIMNGKAQGNVWPEGFIRISNDRVLTYCAMKFDTMAQARNRLKQRGLIDFLPGKGSARGGAKAENPMYRMNYFYPDYAAESSDHPQDRPIFPDGLGDGLGDGPGDGLGDGPGDNIINYTDRQKRIVYSREEDEDEEEEPSSSIARAGKEYAHMRRWASERAKAELAPWKEEAARCWLKAYGRPCSPAVADAIGVAASRGFELSVIREAVNSACIANAANPVEYIKALLNDWAEYGVKTAEDAKYYADLRKDARFGTGTERQAAEEELEEMRVK